MPRRGPTRSPGSSSIRELRLDAWRPIPHASTPGMLGSLSAILSDFTPRHQRPVFIPAQRTVRRERDRRHPNH
jgi:hypothetical protein